MIRIQIIPTWRCNYYDFKKAAPHGKNCEYCVIFSPMKTENTQFQYNDVIRKIDKELTVEEWLDGLLLIREQINDNILFDFTGGEPTLYRDFHKLVHIFSSIPSTSWVITSNTSLQDKIHEIFKHKESIKSCAGWTASWHPNGVRTFDEFVSNLLTLKEYIKNISVTTVLHYSTMYKIEEQMKQLEDLGIQTQIHVYQAQGFSLFKEPESKQHERLLEVYDRIKDKNRQYLYEWDSSMEGIANVRDCNAGKKSIAVSSDGKIFLCYEHMNGEQDVDPIGQWGTFRLKETVIKNCSWHCRYPCDRKNIIER